ncbi:hypothetical protein [Nocardioides sp. KR10-350]|uniref:hypothetical protein n=1 Tax=Nocardioides cheoyonin TaxID=3156615 RepID=UPI0032B3D3EF
MSREPNRTLPGRTVNTEIAGPNGEQALMIEALPISTGDKVRVVFESAAERWRHGIFIATEGELRTEDAISRAYTIWADNAPPETILEVMETDGRLVFYNIWFSGRHAGFESQRYTSGMLREDLDDGWIRYRCLDFGGEPYAFDSIVFRLRIESP